MDAQKKGVYKMQIMIIIIITIQSHSYLDNIDIQNISRVKKDRSLRWVTPLLILAEVPVRAQPGLRGEDLQRIPTISKHRFSQFFLLPIDSHHTSHEMLKLTTGSGLNQNFSPIFWFC